MAWDDSVEKRTELASKMKKKGGMLPYCCDVVEKKFITLWYVTTSCAAVKVVGMADLPYYITIMYEMQGIASSI